MDLGHETRSVNRRLSLRWFEPNTCHHLRKRPLGWGFSDLAGGRALCHVVSSSVRRRRCAAVVTDMWRTESGRSKRFTEPLAALAGVVIRPRDGPGPGLGGHR